MGNSMVSSCGSHSILHCVQRLNTYEVISKRLATDLHSLGNAGEAELKPPAVVGQRRRVLASDASWRFQFGAAQPRRPTTLVNITFVRRNTRIPYTNCSKQRSLLTPSVMAKSYCEEMSIDIPQLLGVRTRPDGHGLVRENFLPLESGLTVLYGVNGSGKTRLLAGIRDGELLVRWPIGEGPWRAGWSIPSVEYEGHGHLSFADGREFLAIDIGNFLSRKDAHVLVDIQTRFEKINQVSNDLGGGIAGRLWEIVLSTVGPLHVKPEHTDLVVGALEEIAKQSLFSIEPLDDANGSGYRITHRIRIDTSTPNSQAICELALRDVQKAKLFENDPFPLDVLLGDRTGVGFLFLEEIGNQSGWGETTSPWWFGSPTHRFPASIESAAVQIFVEDNIDLNVQSLKLLQQAVTKPLSFSQFLKQFETRATGFPSFHTDPEQVLFRSETGGLAVQEIALNIASIFSESASTFFRTVFETASTLRMKINPPEIWDQAGRVTWEALDVSGKFISIGDLSFAQSRWARFSIYLALLEAMEDKPTLILLDEPEAGLHRRAERHLVEGLSEICKNPNISVIVATHSPAFLRSDLARLVHVQRDVNHKIIATSMPSEIRGKMDDLGIDPSDLLQLCRGILLVEGSHDVAVLEGLFGDILRKSGINVFPMRGAKALKEVVDAHLLFEFTEVPVTIMLDNSSTERTEMLWNKACVLFDKDQESDWLGVLDELRRASPGGEGKFLKDFCSRAIRSEQRYRVQFAMLPAPDILDYLPIEYFLDSKVFQVTGLATWEDFRDLQRKSEGGNFKNWLSETFAADFSIQAIERAIAGITTISDDLIKVLNKVARE